MSDIEGLTARVADLSSKADFWNNGVLIFLVMTALAAAGIVICQRLAFVRAGQMASTQNDLDAAKEREARTERDRVRAELATADARIAEAQRGSAEANERALNAQQGLAAAEQHSKEADAKAEGFRLDIAKANERAAAADETAERERLARLQLEGRLADRSLTPQQQTSVTTAIAAFRGVTVDVVIFGDTAEIGRISSILIGAIQRAGWIVHTAQAGGGERTVTGILIGTRPGAEANIVRASNVLLSTLQSMGVAAGPWAFDEMPLPAIRFNTSVTGDTGVRIFIGSKP